MMEGRYGRGFWSGCMNRVGRRHKPFIENMVKFICLFPHKDNMLSTITSEAIVPK